MKSFFCKKKKNISRIINIKDFPIINTQLKLHIKKKFLKKKEKKNFMMI